MKKLFVGLLIGMIALTAVVVKDIQLTKYGTLITFRDNTGYYIANTNNIIGGK